MKTKEINHKWICTDSDTKQYGRCISDRIFEFKQQGVEPAKINVDLYTQEQIESAINSYGYTQEREPKKGLQNIYELYGDDSEWIIAECIFESEI